MVCRLLTSLAIVTAIAAGQPEQPQRFCAVEVFAGSVRLYPQMGDRLELPLPTDVARTFHPLALSPDGRAVYGQKEQAVLGQTSPIIKVEFKPLRASVVPGTSDFGRTYHITASESGRLFVVGMLGTKECGNFEVDPSVGVVRRLKPPPTSMCQQQGPISPDGKYAVTPSGPGIGLLDLESGEVREIPGTAGSKAWAAWSRDAQKIATLRDKKILMVDVPSLQMRVIGESGNFSAVWSPDGVGLLVMREESHCGWGGASLGVVSVPQGQRKMISSSQCYISGRGIIGWLDAQAVR